MKLRFGLVLVTIIMLGFLAGCVARLPREGCLKYHSPQQAFLTGDYDCAQKMNAPPMNEVLKKDPQHKDFALWYLKQGLFYYDAGDDFDSQKNFKTARSVMERIKEDETRETAAIFWSEDVKTYKGDPYEKVLVNLMLGLGYYRNQEYENALSAFRRSISADQLTHNDEEKLRDDNALAHFMAGKCYAHLKEPENAQFHFRKASTIAPDNPYFKPEEIPGKNLIVVIESGIGPMKIRSGIQGSLTTLIPPYPTVDSPANPAVQQTPPYALINQETRAEVFINGELRGSTAEALDVYLQGQSHGWGSKDTVQTVKAVTKEIISHVPYVGILAHLIQAQADIRVWNLVPAKYHVFTAALEPGLYNLTFKFYGPPDQEAAKKAKKARGRTSKKEPQQAAADDQELKYLEQTWYYIPVEEDQETFLVLRTRDFLHAWYADTPQAGGGK